jgi:predicted DNA-binding transcriptional regulator YafY
MRRADRLFQTVQLLRGGRVVKANELARALEVSLRTVYRDVQDLVASGVPIEGEAGVGYCLPRGFDLPPLMFDADEIGALVLGARMVQAWGDKSLAARAKSVLSKVETVLPARLRPQLEVVELYVPLSLPGELCATLETLRRGIDQHRKVAFRYADSQGAVTQRTVRPLCLVFWGTVWTASAWCELRQDFRTFRPDRMLDAQLSNDTFIDEPGRDLLAFRTKVWNLEPWGGAH